MEPELSVRDVLTREYVGVSESDAVLGAVQLMREERVACVLVVRGSEPVGIVTEWDVLGLVADGTNPEETTVGEIMSTPVRSIDADRSLADAADTMTRENIRNLLVRTADGETVGVVTQRDVIAAAGSFQATTSTQTVGPGTTSAPRESTVAETDPLPNGGDEYTTQGVCESCGSLADSLYEANGRLVCSDCRSV